MTLFSKMCALWCLAFALLFSQSALAYEKGEPEVRSVVTAKGGKEARKWSGAGQEDTFYNPAKMGLAGAKFAKQGRTPPEAKIVLERPFHIQIAAGYGYGLALRKDGTVWAWNLWPLLTEKGYRPAQVDGLDNITAIAIGRHHSLALRRDGTVWTWTTRTAVDSGPSVFPTQVPELIGIIAISTRGNHSLALRYDGTVWAWGDNESGQLGDGTYENKETPVQAVGLTGMTRIAAGGDRSFAVAADGTVWAWGANGSGGLGSQLVPIKEPLPFQIPGLTGVVTVNAGPHNSRNLALLGDGTVWTWGDSPSKVPHPLDSITGAVAVEAAKESYFFVLGDGTILNDLGGLGTVGGIYGVKELASDPSVLAAGYNETYFALKGDGTIWIFWDGDSMLSPPEQMKFR